MRAVAFAFVLMLCTANAQAASYTCTPDTFTLEPEGDGLRLKGSLEMPTPGYRYEFTDIEKHDGNALHATLKLSAPEGMVIQVISPLDIDQEFDTADKLVIKVDRTFNWGAAEIICKR
ncbi:MAG: hypothetical protein ACAH80_01540 [Alphaproteobacteria bacterium]